MIEVLLLAIALSMDAFAVSLGLGSKHRTAQWKLALLAGLYFGIFQGAMPLLGYWGGLALFSAFEGISAWVAFFLLAVIGSKMIYDAMENKDEVSHDTISHKLLFVLAIATSIDAMAAGVSLTIFELSIWMSCLLIALTTFVLSAIAVFVGNTGGQWLNAKAELLGGIMLWLIGLKILLS
ncbi:manganese efflux pump MntP family protein [Glaciecola sp. SC05]|uniref:manganese efflux pump MntP n=1 Tax=Glaciecola sp. SC05 TaxID=1987355 RepID=UPI0035294CE2